MVREISGTPPQKTIHELFVPCTAGTDHALHATGGVGTWNALGALINAAAEYGACALMIPEGFGPGTVSAFALVFACPATLVNTRIYIEVAWGANGAVPASAGAIYTLAATTQDRILFYPMAGIVVTLNTGPILAPRDIVQVEALYQIAGNGDVATNIIFMGFYIRWAAT